MANEKNVFVLTRPHGDGEVQFSWQNTSGSLLATTGSDNTVGIFNRRGLPVERIRLPGNCVAFSWDADGDLLGIINAASSSLILWDANTQKKTTVDLGLRDSLTCLMWAKTSTVLAIGTNRGNVAIYNHVTCKKIPILGKHSKKILCGAWSRDNILALGSEDKTVSLNNNEGDTFRIITLRFEPYQITFSDMKLDDKIGRDNTVSILVGKKTLYLQNLDDPDNPIELAFQQRYGSVVTYKWFGDGYILLGFTAGYFVAISTHIKEVGQELFQVINHRGTLRDIAICQQLELVASCGDNTVKIHNMNNLQDTASVLTLDEVSEVEKISWSDDGQLLAIGTSEGSIHVHLSTLPMVHDVCNFKIAILSSINQIAVYEFSEDDSKPVLNTVESPVEPEFIALGQYHLATGLNNRAWFYDMTQFNSENTGPLLIRDREYLSNVLSMKLNTDYASVLYTSGGLQLHLIESPVEDNDEKENRVFPDNDARDHMKITSHQLTSNFLIFATNQGHIRYFSIDDWKFATEFRHETGVKELYSDSSGTRLAFLDDKTNSYLYNPIIDECLLISDYPSPLSRIIWDVTDRNSFIMFDTSTVCIYYYNKDSIYGTSITKVATTKLPFKQVPLMLNNGELHLETPSGKIVQLMLNTRQVTFSNVNGTNNKDLIKSLERQLALLRYEDAWRICELLDDDECWKQFGESALVNLELEWAIRGYKKLKDAGMVWSLEGIAECEDKNALCGHVSMFLGQFDKAEEWYLKSSEPDSALNMRRDLLQWDRALHLAKKLSPFQIPFISREYAAQLEFMGNYSEALSHFEKGLVEPSNLTEKGGVIPTESERKRHRELCNAGIARNSIRVGDVHRGLQIAMQDKNAQLKAECAEILESKKSYSEAAVLYEKAENWDKAAAMYIKLKNWVKVGELFPNVTSHRIHLQYGKAKESDENYVEAAKAYRLAKDYDNLIRIYINHLNNPQEAVAIVQETNSIEGAKLVAAFFERVNDFASAIKFLVKSECFDEAFQLARNRSQMELYGEILKGHDRPSDFRSLAVHFESEKNSLLAGKYYFYAKEYGKALRHLMRVVKNNAEESEAINLAIEVVGVANDDSLTKQLLSYLLGETDGMPKEAKYLFKLYMARKQYREAAKTAIVIANEEQINGSYRVAHDLLFTMYLELSRNGIKIPQEMYSNLMLLHSYILVRLHVKRSNHTNGARLLIRVANSISKFPSHIVPILTSTVIECSRAGLKTSAFNFAAVLMRSEYRSQIDSKYSKKIEAIVRKPGKEHRLGMGEEKESHSPCPICELPVPEYDLNCEQCKSCLPFCIATGRHIVKDDLTVCPNCDFPAIMSELFSLLKSEATCPMCSEQVSPENLIKISDPQPYLQLYSGD
ncbi:hypothetical protein RUM44_003588 [Polyplax serrata]|uniref:WD repeat-containing protein 19 n=1 Tax=Polyplax serrata TaxID=468196 RepID=A0ABR1AGV7_POLSC